MSTVVGKTWVRKTAKTSASWKLNTSRSPALFHLMDWTLPPLHPAVTDAAASLERSMTGTADPRDSSSRSPSSLGRRFGRNLRQKMTSSSEVVNRRALPSGAQQAQFRCPAVTFHLSGTQGSVRQTRKVREVVAASRHLAAGSGHHRTRWVPPLPNRHKACLVSLAVFHTMMWLSDGEADARRLPFECHVIEVTGAWPGDCRLDTHPGETNGTPAGTNSS